MNVIISNTNTNIYILQHRTKEGEENKITTNVNEMTILTSRLAKADVANCKLCIL